MTTTKDDLSADVPPGYWEALQRWMQGKPPEGFVIGPVEPTEEMVAAGGKVIAESHGIDAPKLPAICWHGLARAVYKAMLAAWLASQDKAPLK